MSIFSSPPPPPPPPSSACFVLFSLFFPSPPCSFFFHPVFQRDSGWNRRQVTTLPINQLQNVHDVRVRARPFCSPRCDRFPIHSCAWPFLSREEEGARARANPLKPPNVYYIRLGASRDLDAHVRANRDFCSPRHAPGEKRTTVPAWRVYGLALLFLSKHFFFISRITTFAARR